MSMFNDMVWKKNDENCISNAEKIKNYAMKFSQGCWTSSGPGSEEKWYGNSSYDKKGEWNCTANKMVQRFTETGHPVFKSSSALSRAILKQKKGETCIHFSGDPTNTELLFQTIHSVHELSVHGAEANWCHQLDLTEEEKGRDNFLLVNNNVLAHVRPEEVQLLVSRRTTASGNSWRENVLSFEALDGKIQLTQLCEKTSNIL